MEIKTIYSDWGVISDADDLFGIEEDEVLCKMLGFPLGVENTWKGGGLYYFRAFLNH